MIRHIIPPGEGRIIVDIGCGTGGNIACLAKEYRAFGIDTSIEAIDFAKKANDDVLFLYKKESDSLDKNIVENAGLILLMDVLEHVPDDYAMISEIVQSITSQTYVLITVLANMRLWSQHDESFGHLRRYSLERLEDTWPALPVHKVLLSYYNSRLYPIIKAIRTINSRYGSTEGLAGTDFKMRSKIINNILMKFFSGETRTLLKLLSGERKKGYSRGASIIAILRRD